MLVEVVHIQRQVAVVEVPPVVEAQRQVALAVLAVSAEAQRQVALAALEFGRVVAEQQAAVVEYLSMAALAARVELLAVRAALVARAEPTVRVALAEAAPVVRVAASLVLQGPQMSEAVQAHQKAALADQAE